MTVQFKKQNTTRIKLSKLKVGETVKGMFSHVRDSEITDKDTGELKTVQEYVSFKIDEAGKKIDEKFVFIGDAGLKTSWNDAEVKEGQIFMIEKEEQAELTGGRRVNQYGVYVAQ